MHHELEARIRQGMEEKIHNLESMFNNIHSDFAKCAKDHTSPCIFCENCEVCNGCPNNCNFKWHAHV